MTHIHKWGIHDHRATWHWPADKQVFAFNCKHKEPRQSSHTHVTHWLNKHSQATFVYTLCMSSLTGRSVKVSEDLRVPFHLLIIGTLLGQCVQGLPSRDEWTDVIVAHKQLQCGWNVGGVVMFTAHNFPRKSTMSCCTQIHQVNADVYEADPCMLVRMQVQHTCIWFKKGAEKCTWHKCFGQMIEWK